MSDSEKKVKKEKKVKDKRRVRTVPAMQSLMPFLMVDRVGSMNLMTDRFNVNNLEKYLKKKKQEGLTNITAMHAIIAAYIRVVSQRPALNRFIRGQRIWTRRSIEISLTIKKEMSLDSPDTVVKVVFEPDATIEDVYHKLNEAVTAYRDAPGGDFDNTTGFLSLVPRFVLNGFIKFITFLDYHNLFPPFLEKVSPFHCSMFITSMGSLGIPPIYHHLYNFGICPVFIAFGAKKREFKPDADGSVTKEQYVDISFSLDERICDGFYYAAALKLMKHIIRNPEELDNPPVKVVEDIE